MSIASSLPQTDKAVFVVVAEQAKTPLDTHALALPFQL